jgi:hypothetical protein
MHVARRLKILGAAPVDDQIFVAISKEMPAEFMSNVEALGVNA